MNNTEPFPVTFLPAGKTVLCNHGDLLAEAARRHGIHIGSDCGGRGKCRSCAVRIEGIVPAEIATGRIDFTPEELAQGWRRACQSHLIGSCTVRVPVHTNTIVNPAGQDDGPRVVPIEMPVLRHAEQPGLWYRGQHLIGPIQGDCALGLAVDLGTTNIAAALIDMSSGRVAATGAKENPQLIFGSDVITRLGQAVKDRSAALELQRAAAQAIAELAAKLSGEHPESIAEIAVVGNSVMQHLLLGLPLDSLTHAPYQPHLLSDTEVLASSLGLRFAKGACLYVGPNIAGFVGSDHVAALFETLIDPPKGRWALMDIGTNTELSLFADGQFTSASCASGPAFEGGMLSCGMRAAPGAITRVRLNRHVQIETIGGAEPVGICGSGVLSLVSELRRSGAIDGRGRLSLSHRQVRERANRREFVLADQGEGGSLPVVFTQEDIRAIQLAKAAIRTGLDLLLADAGLEEKDLDSLVIAGAFGKYLDVEEAIAVGLLPAMPRDRIVQVGNAAGAGVRSFLICATAREKAQKLSRSGKYLELATRPEFSRIFARRAMF